MTLLAIYITERFFASMPLSPFSTDNSASQHVNELYPLAQVLVGSDRAGTLIKEVYKRAADVPEGDRPDDEQTWLLGLLLRMRDESSDAPEPPESPNTESSFHSDPFRQEMAARTAKRAIPVAFAACSVKERFILAVDALNDPSDRVLANVLDTTPSDAQSARERAHSALRASLRDVLKGPERMLVDVALPEEALQSHLQDYLETQFDTPPSPLAASVERVVEQAQAEDGDLTAPDSADSDRSWISSRVLLGIVTGLLILGAWLGTATYFDSSTSSPPSANLVAATVDQMSEVTIEHETSTPTDAAQYVRQAWNRHVSVPGVESASLTGVATVDMSPETKIPVFLYSDDDQSGRIAVYAYNYALIEALGDHVTLSSTLRSKLGANRSLIDGEEADAAIVLWRQQDDIFVAVAPHLTPDILRTRLRL